MYKSRLAAVNTDKTRLKTNITGVESDSLFKEL